MKTLLWVIVVLLVAGGLYWILNKNDDPTPVTNTYSTSNTSNDNTSNTSSTTINFQNSTTTVGSSPRTMTVTYNDSGFSPKNIEISRGDTVRFVNNSSGGMWVASAPHPTHSAYDGTTLAEHCAAGTPDSFDQCKNGTAYSFTFTKTGTWNYHNHSDANDFGAVIVK